MNPPPETAFAFVKVEEPRGLPLRLEGVRPSAIVWAAATRAYDEWTAEQPGSERTYVYFFDREGHRFPMAFEEFDTASEFREYALQAGLPWATWRPCAFEVGSGDWALPNEVRAAWVR